MPICRDESEKSLANIGIYSHDAHECAEVHSSIREVANRNNKFEMLTVRRTVAVLVRKVRIGSSRSSRSSVNIEPFRDSCTCTRSDPLSSQCKRLTSSERQQPTDESWHEEIKSRHLIEFSALIL